MNLLTVKLYNLSPVLDIQIDFIFGLQFVSDIQTVQSVSDIQTGLNTVTFSLFRTFKLSQVPEIIIETKPDLKFLNYLLLLFKEIWIFT